MASFSLYPFLYHILVKKLNSGPKMKATFTKKKNTIKELRCQSPRGHWIFLAINDLLSLTFHAKSFLLESDVEPEYHPRQLQGKHPGKCYTLPILPPFLSTSTSYFPLGATGLVLNKFHMHIAYKQEVHVYKYIIIKLNTRSTTFSKN